MHSLDDHRAHLSNDSAGPLVELRGIVKRYGDRAVLDGIDLRIERGETVVLIGGSGSGKSTLARLIIGLDPPTWGQIVVDGVDIGALSERALTTFRRRFAMVFQHHALLDSLTVFDNVAFPLRETTDVDEDEVAERVHLILGELGVDAAAEKLPGELSGGMAKRVAIARAMVIEPEILVYDEPTSGLDPVSSRIVDGLIERMRAEHFVTSLVITHDMVTAYGVADRIVLLAHGKVAADGAPAEVLHARNAEVLPFTVSSGIDLERLGAREGRPSAADIRARWSAARARGTRDAQSIRTEDTKMKESNEQAHGADRLWALRDEIRLKIHLGGMDAKDEWRVIERELDQIQERLGHAADGIADEVNRAIRRLEPVLMKLGQAGI